MFCLNKILDIVKVNQITPNDQIFLKNILFDKISH